MSDLMHEEMKSIDVYNKHVIQLIIDLNNDIYKSTSDEIKKDLAKI